MNRHAVMDETFFIPQLREPYHADNRHGVSKRFSSSMNFAAASCGVSEVMELVFVELLVLSLCSLILAVLLDDIFVAMLADRADQ